MTNSPPRHPYPYRKLTREIPKIAKQTQRLAFHNVLTEISSRDNYFKKYLGSLSEPTAFNKPSIADLSGGSQG